MHPCTTAGDTTTWQPYAAALASKATHPASAWARILSSVPRHEFTRRWWSPAGQSLDRSHWTLLDDPDERHRLAAIYSDRPLVTRVGLLHADHAVHGDRADGSATSSSTAPSSLLTMFEHARLGDGGGVLYVGTGSGYGVALVATRVGDRHVTAVDIDDHVTTTASGHLDRISLHPELLTADATGPLPGTWDRIISTIGIPTIGVPSIPVSWIDALRPGGRLVTTIAHTDLIIIADKTPDGIVGRIGWDHAEFMPARSGPDYPPRLGSSFESFRQTGGEQTGRGRYPVIDLTAAGELRSMLAVTAPGIEHLFQAHDDGRDTAWMFHADGSWARAVGARGTRPRVFQGGPRRLWDRLDRIRDRWLREGSLPLRGAHVTITPHGVIQLTHRQWKATHY